MGFFSLAYQERFQNQESDPQIEDPFLYLLY